MLIYLVQSVVSSYNIATDINPFLFSFLLGSHQSKWKFEFLFSLSNLYPYFPPRLIMNELILLLLLFFFFYRFYCVSNVKANKERVDIVVVIVSLMSNLYPYFPPMLIKNDFFSIKSRAMN